MAHLGRRRWTERVGRSCNGMSHMRRADANGRGAGKVSGEGGSGVPGGQAPVSGSVPGHNRVAVGIRWGGVTRVGLVPRPTAGLEGSTPLALEAFFAIFAASREAKVGRNQELKRRRSSAPIIPLFACSFDFCGFPSPRFRALASHSPSSLYGYGEVARWDSDRGRWRDCRGGSCAPGCREFPASCPAFDRNGGRSRRPGRR